jgi:uncharacterized protein YqhQ
MPVIQFILILAFVGVLLWLVQKFVPMDPTIKKILTIVVIIAVVLWVLSLFGLIPSTSTIRIGR